MNIRERWLYIVTERPWWVIALSFILIVIMATGAKNLYFRGDYKVFFEPDNPQRLAFEEMQNVFAKNENVSILITPHNGNVFTPRSLTLIAEMTEQAWQTPLSTRVDSISNFQHTWSQEDDLIVEDLIGHEPTLTEESIAKIRTIALSEPTIKDKLLSETGHVAMVNITVRLPDGDQTEEVFAITEYVQSFTDSFKLNYPDHDFHLTGLVIMNNEFAATAKNDAETLVPFMFVTIIIIMWLLLHSFSGTLATFIVIVSSIASTLGVAGWMGFYLSTATVNVPTMVMTLAVADCIHIVALMLYQLGLSEDKKSALKHALALNVKAVFITSFTTALGFLTLNFSEVPILADLGNLTAFGVLVACVLALTLLPAMLTVMPVSEKAARKHTGKTITAFSEWVITHYKRILPYSAIVMSVAVLSSILNEINDIPMEYFDDSNGFRQAVDYQQDNLGGMSNVDFVLFSEQTSGINQPEFMLITENFSTWLRLQPEVDHVVSIVDTFKRLNKNMHGDDPDYYRIPKDPELAAQYLLLYEMSLPYGLDINNQVDIDKSATRIMVTTKNLSSNEFLAFETKAKAWMTAVDPNLRMTATSPPLMFAHIGESNMHSMIKGTLLALVLISVLLIFALGSWRLGAVSLIPNLMPAGIGFGIWAMISGEINLALSVVLSMTLGIIVDDTVHFLFKYQTARKLGKSAEDSIRYAFASVGKALLITTLVLGTGFATLTLSSFALNSDMGLLTSIIIVVALVTDFLFLPAFLLFFDKRSDARGAHRLSRTKS